MQEDIIKGVKGSGGVGGHYKREGWCRGGL